MISSLRVDEKAHLLGGVKCFSLDYQLTAIQSKIPEMLKSVERLRILEKIEMLPNIPYVILISCTSHKLSKGF